MTGSTNLIGREGRVSRTGAIRPGRLGEVLIPVEGGLQAYLARDADDGAIESHARVVVVDQTAPRTVLVTRLNPAEEPEP